MRSIVVSDIHAKMSVTDAINSKAAKHGADLILVLGDITHFGPADMIGDFIKKLKLPVYAIPGNCDPRNTPLLISKVATDLHGRVTKIDGTDFVGLGGSNPSPFDTPFELSEEEIYSILEPISSEGMVLMTHAPAYGYNDTVPSGIHVGSDSVRKIVDAFRPIAVLSGHIHEARGIKEENGTLFLNPGSAKDGYCALFSVENGKASAELLVL